MLKKRILTALIALPLLFLTLFYVPRSFIFFVFLFFALGTTFETAGIVLPALREKLGNPIRSNANLWIALCTIVSGTLFTCLAFPMHGVLGIGVFAVMLLLLIANFLSVSIEDAMANMLGSVFSIVYGGLPWLALIDLYEFGDHSRYLFLLLGIVMANDSGAYFTGKYLGKHLLAPLSSPKKTWEGAIGGIFAGILGGWLVNAIYSVFWSELGSWVFIACISVVTGIAGILGDLTESAIKRFGGVKDSGSIFPGHGGLLDRTDSIIFAAPVLWFLLYVTKLDLPIF